MAPPTLLSLPSELLISILQHASSSPNGIHQLLTTSLTCRFLQHTIACASNDHALWHPQAVALGIPASISLDAILFPGTSAPQKRRWKHVVKLNYRWSLPFNSTPALPRVVRCASGIPPPLTGGRKTLELCVAGLGSEGPEFETCGVLACDGGKAWYSYKEFGGEGATFLAPERDALWGYAAGEHEGCHTVKRRGAYAGLVEVEDERGIAVLQYSPHQTKGALRRWNMGSMQIEEFRSWGRLVVALVMEKDSEGNEAKKLVCIEAGEEGRKLWECEIDQEWQDSEDDYYRACKINTFFVTSTHVVCLVLRAPNPPFRKLTRIEFRVLNLQNGALERTIGFGKPLSSHPGIRRRGNLTTALDYPFLLTDKYIVSGGRGGELLVWDYRDSERNGPLYNIPLYYALDEKDPNSFLHTFSAITLSADGRYLGATTAGELFVVDMVRKKVVGRYGNGRRNPKQMVKNPDDGFPSGIWCVWKEWKPSTTEDEWEVVSEGVAYKKMLAVSRGMELKYKWSGLVWVAVCGAVCGFFWRYGGLVWLVMAMVGSVTVLMQYQRL